MLRFLLPILISGFLGVAGSSPSTSLSFPATGVPVHRDSVDILHYTFHLTLSDADDEILGRAEVTARFMEGGVDRLTLDLVGREAGSPTGMRVVEVSQGGTAVDFSHTENILNVFLPFPSRVGDEATVQVTYKGIPEDGLIIGKNKYGDRTFFGDNWPNRARYWLPTVDHPSDKATVEWVVTAPLHYEVVGTGKLVERTNLGEGLERTHWASLVPVATKVMVMGAAPFAVRETGRVGDVPIQAWVYPQDSLAGFHDFSRAGDAVRFFGDRVGPFPYAKLANVQSKTRYGGMENASNIFYAERAVRGDGRNEGLIVHEVAHQWFGDSVTEADWPHLWLSEGFATYLTHLFNEDVYGRDALVEGMQRDRRTVQRFLDSRPDLALVPRGVHDPMELLNQNAYQKGGWLLHMLRRQVGDTAFWSGIRRYYETYRDQNAVTEDFQEVMETVSGLDLEWFFHQWAYLPGHPVLDYDWHYEPATKEIVLTVRQDQPGEPFRFPLDVGVVYPGQEVEVAGTLGVYGVEATISLPVRSRPDEVILDPGCWLLFELRGAVPQG